ncbi:hypothetical protein [Prauserella endophytica]|uniref:hypothetical protein n=1 Tax=Prauserella endophytica TaxID=1592324 RepID=UPI000D837CC6|nr:hypothetical protein [Prauserella endophytica]PXY23189.1 hypothetical protein BAY59_26175 [Prauserella coralliicola]
MSPSGTSLSRVQIAVFTLLLGWAAAAFIPAVGNVQPAGVSLTAWLLAAYMFCVPVVSLLTTDAQDD